MSLILGLDISSTTVRGAFLRTTFRGAEVERYAESPVARPADPEQGMGELSIAVASVLSEVPRPPDRIIATLDGEHASIRMIELPSGVAKRVAAVLPGELEGVLPFNIEDAIIDHQIVGQENGILRVLAVAVRRDTVAQRLEELESVGADPGELAVGAAALDGVASLLPESYRDETLLLIDIGTHSTDLCVLDQGSCIFARTISGGLDLVEAGQRAVLGRALKQTFASYRTQNDRLPSTILLGGEASPVDEATQWLTEQLELPCEVVPLPDAEGVDPSTLPRFVRAAALAGRTIDRRKRLDLRQGEFASKAAAGQLRGLGRLFAASALAIVVAFGFSSLARYRVTAAERGALVEQLESVTNNTFGTKATTAARARELLTASGGPADPLPRFDAYDALEAISASIPKEIPHDTRRLLIEIDDEGNEGRLEIQGTVDSIAQRDQIVEKLKEHECFTEVEKGSISTGAENRKNYKLEVNIACPGAAKPKKKGGRGGSL